MSRADVPVSGRAVHAQFGGDLGDGQRRVRLCGLGEQLGNLGLEAENRSTEPVVMQPCVSGRPPDLYGLVSSPCPGMAISATMVGA